MDEFPRLSNDQIKIMEQQFLSYDKNGDRKLNIEETRQFMINRQLDICFLKAIFLLYDADKDGLISFNDFFQYYDQCSANTAYNDNIFKKIIKVMDQKSGTFLYLNQLVQFGELIGRKISIEEAEFEMDKYDPMRTGRVSYESVLKIFCL